MKLRLLWLALLCAGSCTPARAQNANVQANNSTGALWRPSTFFSGNAAAIKSAAGIPSFGGNSLKVLRLNAGETALEFTTAGHSKYTESEDPVWAETL